MALVSGSSYIIDTYANQGSYDQLTLSGVNPASEATFGIFEYAGAKYFIQTKGSPVANSFRTFSLLDPVPTVGVDTVTYVGFPVANQVLLFTDNSPYGGILEVYNSTVLNQYDKLTYNGESAFVTYIDFGGGVLSDPVYLTSGFSSHVEGLILGTDITISSPVANQIVNTNEGGRQLYVVSCSLSVGDKLLYNNELKTVQSIGSPGYPVVSQAISAVTIDTSPGTGFSANVIGLVIGTDITIFVPQVNQILNTQQYWDYLNPTKLKVYGTSSIELDSLNVGDEVTYNSETATIVGKETNDFGEYANESTFIKLHKNFSNMNSLIGKYIGTDIVVTATGSAPVSDTNYIINDYSNEAGAGRIILKGINPSLWPVSGAYVEYDSQTYWIGQSSGTALKFLFGFYPATAPTNDVDTVTFISESTTVGKVVAYNETPPYGGPPYMYVIGEPSSKLRGYQLNFNGETRYIIENNYRSGGKGGALYSPWDQIIFNTAFTTSPLNETFGVNITLGSAPVTGQVIDGVIGQYGFSVLGATTVTAGQQLTYLGETVTITEVIDGSVYDDPEISIINFDNALTNAWTGKIIGVDIIVSGGGGGGGKPSFSQATRVVEAKLMPAKEARVAEVNLVPAKETRVVEANLVPGSRDKTGLKN